ncbi:hypothetical protein AK812_SmicGene5409 [Symbiodinium microadriaticum]|uniref:Uncharacterized protein n=1 Tax=Symbiodinium microadriaticum TaxID=2951 RepID=A0A1Q9ETW3_SYMMI|nr:hypothetical protein AK812_SmicGene5409 [Symbiodinium microadriaticum]
MVHEFSWPQEAELDLAEERLRLGEACLEDALRLVVPVDDGQAQLAEVVEELERQQASLEVAEAARDSLQDEASDILLLFHAAESRAAESPKDWSGRRQKVERPWKLPEKLRKVLQSFGAAFRRTDVDLYEWSFPVGSIQVFWSHSWHGDKYMKSLLLLLLYNGPAAAIAATISALLMMCLQIAGFLPGLRRVGKSALDQGVTMEFGPWCTATAGLVFLVVLLLGSPGA